LKQAVDGEPGNATYQYHLGLAYLKNGDQALARRTLEAALKLDPASDYADEARGELTRLAALAP
jgi:Flp pilus assembly protein TadD